jgi:hypothetical protein
MSNNRFLFQYNHYTVIYDYSIYFNTVKNNSALFGKKQIFLINGVPPPPKKIFDLSQFSTSTVS